MHDLINRYFDGRLTEEEKQELFSQVQTNKVWEKEFVAMQNLYGLTSWLPSETDNINAIEQLLTFKQARKSQENQKKKTIYRHWMGYAAAVFATLLTTWSMFSFILGKDAASTEKMAEVTYEEFTAPAGQRALLRLQDGTTVWLNARTTLRYPNQFSKTERKVELDGEAFFEVRENPEHPFIVCTEKISVKVTGTKFNVFAYEGRDEFSASLTEGSVVVYSTGNNKDSLVLQPNERGVLEGNHFRKEAFTNMNFLLWKEGIYAFDDVPFRDMVKKLELYYDVEILVNNKDLEDFRFSSKFRQRDGIESVLKTLTNIKHFTYTKNDVDNVITIR